MRITHACSVLATAAYVIPATETAASRWRRGSARPAPLHGLFGGGAKEDVAAGLADDELEVELTRPLGVTVQEGANGRVLVQGCRAGGCAAAAGVAPGDEIIGVSAVFGAGVWRCEGAGLDRVEGLIRAREGSVRLRLRRGAGEPAAASDGLDEEDVDAGTFSAIFDEPSAADGPGAAPDGGALDALVESVLVADFYAPPDA